MVTVFASGGAGTDVRPVRSRRRPGPRRLAHRILGDVYIPSGPGEHQARRRGPLPGALPPGGAGRHRRARHLAHVARRPLTAEDTTAGWYGILISNGTGALGVPPDVSDYHLENCIIEYVVKAAPTRAPSATPVTATPAGRSTSTAPRPTSRGLRRTTPASSTATCT